MPPAAPIGGDLLARRYRLIDRVGAGGMSVVWRARDEVLDRLVAVKWLGSELADDELFRDLVRREAWATARIKHPAVAAVYDYGEVKDLDGQSRAYVVMEMLDGESLSERLRLGPMPWREAVAITGEVADALATTHEQGVVHRDISPDNVMLTSSGLRVFDFGIAAPIGEPDDDATGSTFGTPAYVAPERLDGQPAQTATDVYSLGVLLFEMLTGRPPFPEDTWDNEAALHDRPAPRPRGVAGLPAAVGRLCQRCLSYNPALRPPAREVADRLAAYARPWWQGKLTIAAGALLVVLITAAAFAMTWGGHGGESIATGPEDASGTPVAPRTDTGAQPGSSDSPSTPVAGSPGVAVAPGAGTSSTPVRTSTGPGTTIRTSPPPKPADGQPPPLSEVSTKQALDGLRQTISDGQANGQIRNDVALDLRQQVENISTQLTFTPSATSQALSMIDSLRLSINNRAKETWPDANNGAVNRMALSQGVRDQLLAGVEQLRASVS